MKALHWDFCWQHIPKQLQMQHAGRQVTMCILPLGTGDISKLIIMKATSQRHTEWMYCSVAAKAMLVIYA